MFKDLTIQDLLEETAGQTSAYGGNRISALNGAMAASLMEMVAHLAIDDKKSEQDQAQIKAIADEATLIRKRFMEYIDNEGKAFNQALITLAVNEREVKGSGLEIEAKKAVIIPMHVAIKVTSILDSILYVAKQGNRFAIPDAYVAMMAGRSCVLGALLSVRIYLKPIHDEAFVNKMTALVDDLEANVAQTEKDLNDWIAAALAL